MEAKVSDILIGYISEPEHFQWNNLQGILKHILKLSKINTILLFPKVRNIDS